MAKDAYSNKDLLIRIDERVLQLQKEFKKICEQNKKLDKRIDKLEKWQSYVLGAAGVIGAIIGILGNRLIESLAK